MRGLHAQEKQSISFISIVVPNGKAPTQMFISKISSRKQIISPPESKTIQHKEEKSKNCSKLSDKGERTVATKTNDSMKIKNAQ